MMVALVPAFAAIRLCQIDATVLDTIDRADMSAVRADDFHVLFYAGLSH
jgi:hypothetical protein